MVKRNRISLSARGLAGAGGRPLIRLNVRFKTRQQLKLVQRAAELDNRPTGEYIRDRLMKAVQADLQMKLPGLAAPAVNPPGDLESRPTVDSSRATVS